MIYGDLNSFLTYLRFCHPIRKSGQFLKLVENSWSTHGAKESEQSRNAYPGGDCCVLSFKKLLNKAVFLHVFVNSLLQRSGDYTVTFQEWRSCWIHRMSVTVKIKMLLVDVTKQMKVGLIQTLWPISST